MKNNKGFATTFIVFGLLILFLIITSVLMTTLSNSSSLTSNLRNKLTDDVENPNIKNEYDYYATGDVQTFTAPASRLYTIEGWSTSNRYKQVKKYLDKGQQLYLYIGTNIFNNGNTDVRTVYLTSTNFAKSRASIILDTSTGTTNDTKPAEAGSNGFVRIKYNSLSADNVGYDDTQSGLNCSNVQCALETMSKIINKKYFICKKATSLHTADISGRHITFGQIGTEGTLAAGDAFDCDVNGDGTYDPETERFYYVSDYFDTSSRSFNNNYAVLIYYTNVSRYSSNENSTIVKNPTFHANYSYSSNLTGPNVASLYLPNINEWKAIRLYKGTRLILDPTNTSAGSFKYTGVSGSYDKVARFITHREISKGLNKTFLFENTYYQNHSYVYGYWLESIYSNNQQNTVYAYDSRYASLQRVMINSTNYGIRPTIELNKMFIEY